MHLVRWLLMYAVVVGSGSVAVMAAAEDQPVPQIDAAPEEEDQHGSERLPVHCE